MDRVFLYSTAGCFIGTIIALLLYQYKLNPFLMFLLPMWGLVFGVAIARAVNSKHPENAAEKGPETEEQILL